MIEFANFELNLHLREALMNLKEIWYVYIIQCKYGSYYTGITNNIQKRLELHSNNKGAKYLKGRGPLKIVASWEFSNKSEAAKREAQIKKLTKKQKEKLINGQ